MTQGLKIVIVEDDALIAMDLADLLIGMGHDVCAIASTESEAIVTARRCKPDLMIVDGGLQEGNGIDAMRRIATEGFIPHLFVTGDPQRLAQGAPDAVIVGKPFTMRELSRGIAAALASGVPASAD
ncbi:response regulator [Novosphingobium sp. FKTRR1]|uniref:response regulator n=1 Tax=Novosphingobium sp. FKTRR1 TaxID=2879118 RepID=UPI001CEFF195|nr:response regulator [Novosphingobium sp. FKTRR1]